MKFEEMCEEFMLLKWRREGGLLVSRIGRERVEMEISGESKYSGRKIFIQSDWGHMINVLNYTGRIIHGSSDDNHEMMQGLKIGWFQKGRDWAVESADEFEHSVLLEKIERERQAIDDSTGTASSARARRL